MNNKALILFVIGTFLVQITAIVCITFAAIHFQKSGILWWYLVPLIMGISSVDIKNGGDDNTNRGS